MMFGKDKVFELPDVTRADEFYREPAAVQRHYLVLRNAKEVGDRETIGNRQLRLLGGGFEVPITLSQCNRLLEKYSDDSKPGK